MLDTNRLHLRPVNISDSVAVFKYRSDAETNKYQGFVPKALKEVEAFIEKNPSAFNQPDTWFQLVVIEKKSNQIIGDIGVHFIGDDGFQCELGCTLSKQFQGKGFATEAMRATIDYLFNVLNKHRIIGSVDPLNHSSIQLLERVNFRKEAHFKESLLIDGEWIDDIIFGLLKKDWNS